MTGTGCPLQLCSAEACVYKKNYMWLFRHLSSQTGHWLEALSPGSPLISVCLGKFCMWFPLWWVRTENLGIASQWLVVLCCDDIYHNMAIDYVYKKTMPPVWSRCTINITLKLKGFTGEQIASRALEDRSSRIRSNYITPLWVSQLSKEVPTLFTQLMLEKKTKQNKTWHKDTC